MGTERQIKLRRWVWVWVATALLASLVLAETLTVFACNGPSGGC
jgi:hypothetical protein